MHGTLGSPTLWLCALASCTPMFAVDDLLGPIQIHGFVSQGYLRTSDNNYLGDTKNGSAQFNELAVNFNTRLENDLQVGIQFLARDLGNQGQDKPIIDWACLDYRHYDWIGIRAGIIKTPIGFYNDSRDLDFARTFVLLPEGVYPEQFRDFLQSYTGAGIYGNVSIPHAGSVDYHVFAGDTTVDSDSSVAQSFEAGAPAGDSLEVSNINFKYEYGGQVIWNTPLSGFRLGATYSCFDFTMDLVNSFTVPTGAPPPAPATTSLVVDATTDNKLWMKVGSAEYIWHDLTLAGEYMFADLNTSTVGASTPETIDSLHGYYLSASYRLSPKVEVGGYWSTLRLNHHDQSVATNYLKDYVVCARYDFNRYWLLKLEGHYYQGNFTLLKQLNEDAQGNAQFAKDWWMFAAKTTVNF
jgi:hypothetical protein